jgi:malonyl-CoA/methylmalonyl-CoA synthetase
MSSSNLFVALRAAFPADLDAVAVETDSGLRYSWRDLDRATAMVANLLQSLDIPRTPTACRRAWRCRWTSRSRP